MKALDIWQRARKSPYSGDLAIGGAAYVLARFLPIWLGAWQPSMMEGAIAGGVVALASYCLDWVPDDNG